MMTEEMPVLSGFGSCRCYLFRKRNRWMLHPNTRIWYSVRNSGLSPSRFSRFPRKVGTLSLWQIKPLTYSQETDIKVRQLSRWGQEVEYSKFQLTFGPYCNWSAMSDADSPAVLGLNMLFWVLAGGDRTYDMNRPLSSFCEETIVLAET